MQRTISLCSICYDDINAYGNMCIDLCILACEGAALKRISKFDESENWNVAPIAEFLEHKGILATAEISQTEIAIKPTCEGFLNDNGDVHFCWCVDEE